MTIAASAASAVTVAPAATSPWLARTLLLVVVAAGFAVGLSASDADTSDPELALLLRTMAAIKLLLAAAAAAAVFWRLGAPVRRTWLTAYAVAAAVMATGPGLIWGLGHVAVGAALLHAGLAATLVLLWRDRVVGLLLAQALAARRRSR